MTHEPFIAGASAPGKIMIAGEYAVLEGAPALVGALQTRARALFFETNRSRAPETLRPLSKAPEAAQTRALAETHCGTVPRDILLDVASLRHGDRKLGVGSSAAGAAACSAAVFAWHGHDLEQPDVSARVLDVAMRGHRAVAPEGSGADVAASALGGVVSFRRTGTDTFDAKRLPWPKGLIVRVVWTGQEARTSNLVRQVRAWGQSDPTRYTERMAALTESAQEFVAAYSDGNAERVLSCADQYGEAMAALGRESGAPIVEERLSKVRSLAQEEQGAAKPSGAGGGDVALGFFTDANRARRFEDRCAHAGFAVLDATVGGPGVRIEPHLE